MTTKLTCKCSYSIEIDVEEIDKYVNSKCPQCSEILLIQSDADVILLFASIGDMLELAKAEAKEQRRLERLEKKRESQFAKLRCIRCNRTTKINLSAVVAFKSLSCDVCGGEIMLAQDVTIYK